MTTQYTTTTTTTGQPMRTTVQQPLHPTTTMPPTEQIPQTGQVPSAVSREAKQVGPGQAKYVVAVDGSEYSLRAYELLRKISKPGDEITLVTVVSGKSKDNRKRQLGDDLLRTFDDRAKRDGVGLSPSSAV